MTTNHKIHNKNRVHSHHAKHKGNWHSHRAKPTFETGIIESVSEQGHYVFVSVRRTGKRRLDVDGNAVYSGQTLFGNEFNVTEKEITCTEVLLPSDINPRQLHPPYKKLIGQSVKVEMHNNIPRMVYLVSGGNKEARIADREPIRLARTLNKDLKLDDDAALNFLEFNGISRDVALQLNGEKYVNIMGNEACYGDNVTYGKSTITENNNQADMSTSQNQGLVTFLFPEKLKTKPCHQAPLALSGL